MSNKGGIPLQNEGYAGRPSGVECTRMTIGQTTLQRLEGIADAADHTADRVYDRLGCVCREPTPERIPENEKIVEEYPEFFRLIKVRCDRIDEALNRINAVISRVEI